MFFFKKEVEKNEDPQKELESIVKKQLFSILEKKSTLVMNHPSGSKIIVYNPEISVTFVINISESKIIISKDGVTDNGFYSCIFIGELVTRIELFMKKQFSLIEQEIQNKRVAKVKNIEPCIEQQLVFNEADLLASVS